jgi:hypothetical protein
MADRVFSAAHGRATQHLFEDSSRARLSGFSRRHGRLFRLRLAGLCWQANPTWGRRPIQGELAKQGTQASDSSIRKYRPKNLRSLPSQTWKTFLRNHAHALIAVDFFAVPTATFRVLYVFLVLAHERRRILHFNITEAPLALWTAQQMVEAFPLHDPATLFAPGSGCHLWRGVHPLRRGSGLETKAHCPAIILAESHGRTTDWFDSPRVFGPPHCPQYAAPPPNSL